MLRWLSGKFTEENSLVKLESLASMNIWSIPENDRVRFGSWLISEMYAYVEKNSTEKAIAIHQKGLIALVKLGRSITEIYRFLQKEQKIALGFAEIFSKKLDISQTKFTPQTDDVLEGMLLPHIALQNVKENVYWFAILLSVMSFACSELEMTEQKAQIEEEIEKIKSKLSSSDCWCLLITRYLYQELYGFECDLFDNKFVLEKIGLADIDLDVTTDDLSAKLQEIDPLVVLCLGLYHKIDSTKRDCYNSQELAQKCSANQLSAAYFLAVMDHDISFAKLPQLCSGLSLNPSFVKRVVARKDACEYRYLVKIMEKFFIRLVQDHLPGNELRQMMFIAGIPIKESPEYKSDNSPKSFKDVAELKDFTAVELFNTALSVMISSVEPEHLKLFALCPLVCQGNRDLICGNIDKNAVFTEHINKISMLNPEKIFEREPTLVAVFVQPEYKEQMARLCIGFMDNITTLVSSDLSTIGNIVRELIGDDQELGYTIVMKCLNAGIDKKHILPHANISCYARAIGTYAMDNGPAILKDMTITSDNVSHLISGIMMANITTIGTSQMAVLKYVISRIRTFPLDTSNMTFKSGTTKSLWMWKEDPVLPTTAEQSQEKPAQRTRTQGISRGHDLMQMRKSPAARNIWKLPDDLLLECTFKKYGRNYIEQPYFHCHTCDLMDGKGVCVPCALTCHKGHDLSYARVSGFYCDCHVEYDQCIHAHPEINTDESNENGSGSSDEQDASYIECDAKVLTSLLLFLDSLKISEEAASLVAVKETKSTDPYEVPLTFWTWTHKTHDASGLAFDQPLEILQHENMTVDPDDECKDIIVESDDDNVIVGFELKIAESDDWRYTGSGYVSINDRKYNIEDRHIVLIPLKPSEVGAGNVYTITFENESSLEVQEFTIHMMDPSELLIPESDEIEHVQCTHSKEEYRNWREEGETLFDFCDPLQEPNEKLFYSLVRRLASGIRAADLDAEIIAALIRNTYQCSTISDFMRRIVVTSANSRDQIVEIWKSVMKDVISRTEDEKVLAYILQDAQKMPEETQTEMNRYLWQAGKVKHCKDSVISAFVS